MSQTLFGDTDDLSLYGLAASGQQGYDSLGSSNWFSLLGSLGFAGVVDSGPDEDGWYDYQYSRPRKDILLQFQRRGYVVTQWIGYADFHEMFNVADLYWRYTGIGKHQMEPKPSDQQIKFHKLGGTNLPVSPASVTTSATLPNTTAVYTGAKKPKAKKKPKGKSR
jgi:hypothetical protein